MSVADARAAVVLNETAANTAGRVATISQSVPSAMSSGPWGKTRGGAGRASALFRPWVIRFDVAPSWRNRLSSGWKSTQDTLAMQTQNLKFDTAEQAVLFCERNGWAWACNNPTVPKVPIALRGAATVGNQYSYNILPLAITAGMKSAGLPRRAKEVFAYDASTVQTGVSTWTNYRTTGFGPDAWRPRKATPQTGAAWTGPGWAAHKDIPPPEES